MSVHPDLELWWLGRVLVIVPLLAMEPFPRVRDEPRLGAVVLGCKPIVLGAKDDDGRVNAALEGFFEFRARVVFWIRPSVRIGPPERLKLTTGAIIDLVHTRASGASMNLLFYWSVQWGIWDHYPRGS